MTRRNAVVEQLGIRLPGGLATFGVLQADAPLRSALVKSVLVVPFWPSEFRRR
ncbi:MULTISPECIES: hypothetical protein [unclassified Rhodococcus (in: high G+C Gram-positive bacteria)]|uniref:hypothetical protein n=1 Tax=unclassified Rhodococcus (in: high G+C Gram-positive bacteria) TaxID=192944 RepID=UPI001639CBBF|nr:MULTISPECIES: hypothetical protein [unclassified Rhodococcus (in: high G+C Gram-positive bacteria)]MBC2637500.1 hypothetical protein [Rhodococcus sp. 3A]MBC2898408.1 hypothetical protein [Rhodococcus sp. 4CII]